MENEDTKKRKNRVAVFEHIVEKEKPKKKKKFYTNRIGDESSPSESELVIDDMETRPVRKKKKKPVKLSEEPLNLVCEWDNCNHSFDQYMKFNIHLTDHISQTYGFDNNDVLECVWANCTRCVEATPMMLQHISYHGYLTKLKNIGNNVLQRNTLPACHIPKDFKFPYHKDGYTCEWEFCQANFLTVYDFYEHIQIHVKNNPKLCKPGEIINCHWKGCSSTFQSQYKLAEHVRVHTKEKTIACPTCEALFSTKTKFADHRKRQLPIDLQSYQCSQCLKLFPTERLVRDHMRSHINHYKCTMCDMTCPKPSVLAKHIRYRHVKFKPFKCPYCDSSFVTNENLKSHMQTHDDKNPLECDMCEFSCRSAYGLERHFVKEHGKEPTETYECHCCKQQFRRGCYLTKHLMKIHNYHWPSGHSRFRYRRDQDGIFRIQTVRYESLEVTEEMIRSESMQASNTMPSRTYNLTNDDDKSCSFTLMLSEGDAEQNVDDPLEETGSNNVLITINDVDEHGNIVKSQVIQSTAIICTDAIVNNAVKGEEEIDVTDQFIMGIQQNQAAKIKQTVDTEAASVDDDKLDIKDEKKIKEEEESKIHYFSKEVLNCDKVNIQTNKSE